MNASRTLRPVAMLACALLASAGVGTIPTPSSRPSVSEASETWSPRIFQPSASGLPTQSLGPARRVVGPFPLPVDQTSPFGPPSHYQTLVEPRHPELHPVPTPAHPRPKAPAVGAALARVSTAPAVRTLPLPPTFQLPRTGVEYLRFDGSLSESQRDRVSQLVRGYEVRRDEHRNLLRDELNSLEALTSDGLTVDVAREIVMRRGDVRAEEQRILHTTLVELRRVLSPKQWQRFSGWVGDRPWMPFHRLPDANAL